MAFPPLPPLIEHLASRPFSFYPAIVSIEHNEWRFRKATWSEIVVVNTRNGVEIVIPRKFVGEVSLVDDPVLIVGLTRELEYRAGIVCPVQRRVIQMPLAVGGERSPAPPVPHRDAPAPVVGIRVESRSGRRILRLIGGAVALLVLLFLLVANWMRWNEKPRPERNSRGPALLR